MAEQPTGPARFTAMMQALAADTREAPNTIRHAEALKACLTTLRSIGYGAGCDIAAQILDMKV